MLMGALFGAPLLGFVTAAALTDKLDDSLRSNIMGSAKGADPEKIGRVTLAGVCSNERTRQGIPDACFTSDTLRWMRWASLGSACIGLTLLVGISLAGRVAVKNRTI